jgi:uncharacterized repeat protein (TIGR03803 family)
VHALAALLWSASLVACSTHQSGSSPLPFEALPLSASSGYESIYSFGQNGKADDGFSPVADVIAVGSEFYGTTQYGGTTNEQCYLGCGTVFKVSASGVERVVYRFQGSSDGALPTGGLIEASGALFGTTSSGGVRGSICSGGCGTVFKLSTDGKEEVLYSFTGGTDGAVPIAGLVSLNGSFYGTTEFGGTSAPLCSDGCGTVFKVSPSGSESIVYRFLGGKDGAQPVARLIALHGKFYGTTEYGGASTELCATGCGTLFGMNATGAKKILHKFKYTSKSGDGAYPTAGPTAMNGELYGTTTGGGKIGDGTVFKVNLSSGAERVIHSFSCCTTSTDGEYPFSHLARVSGALYGTTRNGGTANSGTIFEISPSGSENVLHDFTGKPDGAQPVAGLLANGGILYGATSAGGSSSEGTVFKLTP